MPGTNTNINYYDFSDTMLTSQSILDVFVIQDLIDQSDADKLRKKFRTNREIENFLIENRIVSRETINKAYSIILKLPYVELGNVQIPDELKTLVPEKVAKRLGIIPFAIEDGAIRIALSRPADLLVGFRSSLGKILSEKNLEIELFITSDNDFAQCIKQYSKKFKSDVLLKKGSFPVVYLRNQAISKEYLEKIPAEFMEKYRIAVFGKNSRNYYLVACEQPDSPIILKILNFIKIENKIKFEIFATSKEDIDYLLKLRLGQVERAGESEITAKPANDRLVQDQSKKNAPEGGAAKNRSETESPTRAVLKELLDSFIDSAGPELTIDNLEKSTTGSSGSDAVKKELEQVVKNPRQQISRAAGEPKQESTVSKTKASPVVQDAETKEAADKQSVINKQESGVLDTSGVPEEEESESTALLDNKNLGAWLDHDISDIKDLTEYVSHHSVPRIVAAIIDFAINSRSSDIHVEPEAKILRIRCRVDGILRDVLKLPMSIHPSFVSRIKIMSKLKIDEMRIPQDGRFDTIMKDREIDVRVSTLPTVHGEKVVMRILDKSGGILSLEDLGMVGSAFEKTVGSIGKPYGIILSTGPTGSGKSTTLYAVLNRISMPGVNIVTLEDPVEYEINGINQCQIKPEIGFTFASGLRSILRQDPNVIMVGEVRDAETAGMAVHAALTGHLVLSTLHTNDTAGALPRLINMGVEPYLITSSINLVLAQRLVRRICPKCREEYKAPQKLLDQVKEELDKIPVTNTKDHARIPDQLKLYHGKGCPECSQGFKGRLGIFEAMEMTPEIESMAIAKRPAHEIKDASVKAGMITMKQDGLLKAVAGETTIDEVFQAVITN